MGGNSKTVVPDHFAHAFESAPPFPAAVEREAPGSVHASVPRGLAPANSSSLHKSVHRKRLPRCRPPRSQLAQAPQNLHRLLVPDIDNDIGIGQVSHFHLQALAPLGQILFPVGKLKIVGQAKMRSKCFCKALVFSRRITSSPRRRISTSFPRKRYSFGTRTA